MKSFIEQQKWYQLLIKQRNELSQRIEKIDRDLKKRRSDARLNYEKLDNSNDDVLGALKNEAQVELDLTLEAIERFMNGEFGNCLECTHQINKERLAALPHAQLCLACASKQEVTRNVS